MMGLPLVVCLVAGLWSSSDDAQARMYRWVDDDGEVHYTDHAPSAEFTQGVTKFDEVGMPAETIPPVPTEEELRQASERERAREEEARHVAERKAADQKLLRTYRSIEELNLTRDGKLAAIDARIQSKRHDIRLEQERLLGLQAQLKDPKRSGEPAAGLKDDIARSELRIRGGYADIIGQELQKDAIRKEFERVVARFSEIRALPEPAVTKPASTPGPLPPNLVSCNGAEQCGQYWTRATAYVSDNSDAQDRVNGPGLLMSFLKDGREDRWLTLVWIQTSAEEPVYLYFDLQCVNRLTADTTCANQKALDVRDGFRAAVTRRAD